MKLHVYVKSLRLRWKVSGCNYSHKERRVTTSCDSGGLIQVSAALMTRLVWEVIKRIKNKSTHTSGGNKMEDEAQPHSVCLLS